MMRLAGCAIRRMWLVKPMSARGQECACRLPPLHGGRTPEKLTYQGFNFTHLPVSRPRLLKFYDRISISKILASISREVVSCLLLLHQLLAAALSRTRRSGR